MEDHAAAELISDGDTTTMTLLPMNELGRRFPARSSISHVKSEQARCLTQKAMWSRCYNMLVNRHSQGSAVELGGAATLGKGSVIRDSRL